MKFMGLDWCSFGQQISVDKLPSSPCLALLVSRQLRVSSGPSREDFEFAIFIDIEESVTRFLDGAPLWQRWGSPAGGVTGWFPASSEISPETSDPVSN